MNKITKLLFLFLIIGTYSCDNTENNKLLQNKQAALTKNSTSETSKFEPNGYYDPKGDTVFLYKYRFESLVIWLPNEDEKPEVFLHFVNYKLKRKAINIYFKNYIIKPKKILLSESDTLNGEISFEGKFLKETEPTDEDTRNETIVLTGNLRIKEKIYKLDFTYFPGD